MNVHLELEKKRQEIDAAQEYVRKLNRDVVEWCRENKQTIKSMMPTKGRIYKLKSLERFNWWDIQKYCLTDEVYYFKPTNTRFDPKNWFRYACGEYFIPVKGDILDCNFRVVVSDKQIPIYDIEEVKDNRDISAGKRKITSIYVMIDKNTGYYKIGRSVNPKKRERTLQSEKPTIEMLFNHDARVYDEKHLHDMFQEKRVRGEWFDLSGSDLSTIQQYFNNKKQ